MTLTLSPELEAALKQHAARRGETSETLALRILGEVTAQAAVSLIPQDAWEQNLLSGGYEVGANLTEEQLTRDVSYEE